MMDCIKSLMSHFRSSCQVLLADYVDSSIGWSKVAVERMFIFSD